MIETGIIVCVGGTLVLPLVALALVLVALSGRAEGRRALLLIAPGVGLLLAAACAVAAVALLTVRGPAAGPAPLPTDARPGRATPTPTATATIRPTVEPTSHPTRQPTGTPPGRATGITPYGPSLLPGEEEAVAALDDPPVYTLDVRVDWDALTVAGNETLLVTNNEPVPLAALYLRLYPNADHYEEGGTAVGAVSLNGVALAPGNLALTTGDTVLEIALPQPLRPDEQVTLTIPFTVSVPRRPDRFGFEDDVMMLGHWYPMLAVYDDEGWNLDPYVEMGDAFYSETGSYTVHLTVPEGTVVASTGVEVERVGLRTPEARVTLVSGGTRDFALALSPRYLTRERWIGEVRVTSFYLPGDENGGQMALDVAADALEVFARFGPYPYTELDVAETPFLVLGSPGGMEFPGLVFVSSTLYEPDGTYAGAQRIIVAHEVAHQWWYGIVGNNQVDEPWLDESFASFAEILYVREIDGETKARAEESVWLVMPYLMTVAMGEDRPVATSLLEFEDPLIYSAIVYSKGALFLRELEEMTGDETFFAILQHHYRTYRYGIVPPDGFRRSIATVTGDDADALALYDLWILSGETPPGAFD